MIDETILADGRELAEARMLDTCVITEPGSGHGSWNADKAAYDDAAPTVIYGPDVEPHRGKCRIRMQGPSAGASAASAGPEQWSVREPTLHLPIAGTENVGATNQICEVTAAADDQALVGRKFGFTGPAAQSQATARRLRIKEAVGT